jgi:hypothetical protein
MSSPRTRIQNTNLLQSNKWQVTIDRIPTTVYFCNGINFPSISAGEVDVYVATGVAHFPNSKILYEPLSFTFNIDEDMRAYRELLMWMKDNSAEKTATHPSIRRKKVSDVVLTMYSNLNNPTIRFKFKSCFPTLLGGFRYETTNQDTTIMVADVELRYDEFDMEYVSPSLT